MERIFKSVMVKKTNPAGGRRGRGGAQARWKLLESLESRQLMSVDLAGFFVTIPVTAAGGTRQNVVLNIQNRGTTLASGNLTVRTYEVPTGTTFSPSTATLVSTVVRGVRLASGGSVNAAIPVPTSVTTPPGTYQLFSVIDPNNRFADTNLSNNTVQSSVFIVTQRNVDVVPSMSLVSIPNLTAGVPGRGVARVTFTNGGVDNFAGNTPVGLRIVARPVGAVNTSQEVVLTSPAAQINMGNLAPGASRSANVVMSFPATMTAGSWNLVLTADPNNTLPESNEFNNSVILTTPVITVATPVVVQGSGSAVAVIPTNGQVVNNGAVVAVAPVNSRVSTNGAVVAVTPVNGQVVNNGAVVTVDPVTGLVISSGNQFTNGSLNTISTPTLSTLTTNGFGFAAGGADLTNSGLGLTPISGVGTGITGMSIGVTPVSTLVPNATVGTAVTTVATTPVTNTTAAVVATPVTTVTNTPAAVVATPVTTTSVRTVVVTPVILVATPTTGLTSSQLLDLGTLTNPGNLMRFSTTF